MFPVACSVPLTAIIALDVPEYVTHTPVKCWQRADVPPDVVQIS